MKVNLAGFNIDTVVIEELLKNSAQRHDVTPEVISASYARISRDPRSIEELRESARGEVERARKSNKSIIFQMGHHSIAEHAVFNFDIIGISRLAIESIEKHRLCSFTEKSQRYITLENEYFVPVEIAASEYKNDFVDLLKQQNEAYAYLYEKLKTYVFSQNPESASLPKNHSTLEGWAKEDARYITSLATPGQLGLTVNARNMELMFRRFASSPLEEVRELGSTMYKLAEKVAPSVILFVEPNEFDRDTYRDIADFVLKEMPAGRPGAFDEVEVVNYSKEGDTTLLAALAHSAGKLPFKECASMVKNLSAAKKRELVLTAFKKMKFYDSVLREFEFPDITFELVVSAACFGQVKRHRMATITAQSYDTALGVTIPDSIKNIGEEKLFISIVKKSEAVAAKLHKINPDACQYALTNAHRRRVLIKTNARELYHISRLREDAHAQWDIRRVSALMAQKAAELMPYTFMLLCGKDKFDETYKKIFS